MLGYGRIARRYPLELPRLLREAGYFTLGIGKMHYWPHRHGHGFHQTVLDEDETAEFRSDYSAWVYSEAPGWQAGADPAAAEPALATGLGWNDHRARPWPLTERLHPTHWTAETALRFLGEYRDPRPFFLTVSFMRPHSPYDPPRRWLRKYHDLDLPKAARGAWSERHAGHGQPYPDDLWRGDVGAEQVRRSRQGYYGSVSYVDEQVGRVLDVLQRRGWLEETLILYTADHGDMTGDHYLWRKCYPYEGSARVPLLVRWPEGLLTARRGQVFSRPVELRDVLPTFLDAAGAPVDPGMVAGRSLLDLVRGKGAWRPFVDLEHDVCYSRENHWNALTDGHFKYVFHALDGAQQLFDLDNGPGEAHDLAAEPGHRAALNLWRGRLRDHLAERGKPFVVGGELALRPESFLYGRHYPKETR
jgi:arylsulfatase A-like enzyme